MAPSTEEAGEAVSQGDCKCPAPLTTDAPGERAARRGCSPCSGLGKYFSKGEYHPQTHNLAPEPRACPQLEGHLPTDTSSIQVKCRANGPGLLHRHSCSLTPSISALLTMPKPLTVWFTINCGKFFKRWEYQTTLPAS